MSSNYYPAFPKEWQKVDLYSCAIWINGLAFKKINFEAEGKYPIVKINELKYGITGQTAFTNQTFDECYSLSKDDLLFSWSGSPETSIDAFWYDLKEGWLNQHIFKVVPQKYINKDFLYYLLKYIKPEIIRIAKDKQTTGLGHITKGDMKELIIAYPDLEIQKRLVKVVKDIDDKIDLNRQTNQTLEAIAQALFKEWFVDFNFPGTTGEMEESELGEIPKGWKVGKLGDVCELIYGKALKAENRISGEYPVVGSSGIVGVHNEYLIDAPGIVIGRKGTIGKVNWLDKNFYPIDTTFYIKDKLGAKLYYHYFLLKSQDFKKISTDSAVPGLNREQAINNLIILPQLEVITRFNKVVEGIFNSINNNKEQNQTLVQLRDSLLPKLMRGEIAFN